MRFTVLRPLALALALVAGAAACTEPRPPEPPPRTPVVLVHGFLGEPWSWNATIPQFKARGYAADDLFTVDYDYRVAIVESAKTLAQEVDRVLDRTGATKVDILSHSQGSLVTKQCIIVDGCQGKVDHWMSLSGVDNGTDVELGLAKNMPSNEDVQGRTPVIQNLQDRWGDLVAQGVKVEVQWTRNDQIVEPPERSQLPPPAVNKEVSGAFVYHLTITTNPAVIEETVRFFGT